tara:strand:+ start:7967 stop:8155 length:189 start_codon:yes stop_codon:yes gene_type:complete
MLRVGEGGNITTHYSIAEISELIETVEKIAVESSESMPSLTLIRIGGSINARKTPVREIKKA